MKEAITPTILGSLTPPGRHTYTFRRHPVTPFLFLREGYDHRQCERLVELNDDDDDDEWYKSIVSSTHPSSYSSSSNGIHTYHIWNTLLFPTFKTVPSTALLPFSTLISGENEKKR